MNINNYKGLQVITAVMIRTCMGVGCNYYEFQLLLLETLYLVLVALSEFQYTVSCMWSDDRGGATARGLTLLSLEVERAWT